MTQENGFLAFPKGYATDAIHHAQEPENWDSMAIVAPIVTSVPYKLTGPAQSKKYEYSRGNNPTRHVLESVLAKLDNAKYGLAFSSGMGATTAVLGLLNGGEHLICGNDVFGGTNRLFRKVATKYGIDVTIADFADLTGLEKNIKENSKMIWIETVTNPTTQVIDIQAVSKFAKKHGLILAVDNTLLTSYLMRPLNFGVDVVVYSLTKYMNGHSDVLMGALVTSNDDIYEKLKYLQKMMGGVPSPFDCYQVNRSLKTLVLRLKQHMRASLALATYLESHPKVEKVLHPGLPSHPQHELFKRQTSGHSGTFAFYIKGNLDTSEKFLTSLKLITLAGSLGACDSLIELPSKLSHATITAEERAAVGITDNLIRISVGLEDEEYLIADLEQAFNAL